MLGYSGRELMEMVFTEFTHSEDATRDLDLFQKLISEEVKYCQMERRYNCKDGRILYGLMNLSLVASSEDKPSSIMVTVDDISDRKKVEQELIIINKLMEAVHSDIDIGQIYNISLDIINLLDNVEMAAVYITDEEKNLALLQAARNLPNEYLENEAAIKNPYGITWKVINTRKALQVDDAQEDPEIGPIGKLLGHRSLLGIPLFYQNETIGVIWFISHKDRKLSDQDVQFLTALGDQISLATSKAKLIHELKFTQEQLIQSEKLASIGQLISSIAHEINNLYCSPLRS